MKFATYKSPLESTAGPSIASVNTAPVNLVDCHAITDEETLDDDASFDEDTVELATELDDFELITDEELATDDLELITELAGLELTGVEDTIDDLLDAAIEEATDEDATEEEITDEELTEEDLLDAGLLDDATESQLPSKVHSCHWPELVTGLCACDHQLAL